jgi:hypothetical protein
MQSLCLDVVICSSVGLSQARNTNGQFVLLVSWGIAIQKVASISLPYESIIHYQPDTAFESLKL